MQQVQGHQLHRGRDRILGGVCSGLAEYFSADPLLIRLAFVLLTLASGVGVLLYVVLWVLVPEEGEASRQGGSALATGVRSVESDVRRVAADVRDSFGSQPPASGSPPASPESNPGDPAVSSSHQLARRRGIWLGGLLVAVGGLLLAETAGLLWWWDWNVVWPALLIALGVLIVVRGLR